jgi:L-type amino acid transporter 5
VLTPVALVSSDAIAVTFANNVLGQAAWIIPVMVAISAFGGLSVHIMTSSRMLYVGARNGHFPAMLSHLNVNKLTPMPSLVFLNILSLFMLLMSDIHTLITYCTIVESFFMMLSVSGLLYLRWKKPDIMRPIKVNIIFPILFVLICLFLIIFPCFDTPLVVGIGALITLSGMPVYYFGVVDQYKPLVYQNVMGKLTEICQKIFVAAHEDEDVEE